MAKKFIKRAEIAKSILMGLATVGVVAVAVAAPNAVLAFQGLYKPFNRFDRRRFQRSFSYLNQKKLIGIGEKNGKTIIKLTEKGEEKLLQFKLEDLTIKVPKKWDGKFRLVLFDVPEKLRYARQELSAKLKEIGFKPMQKSVWICPYPCKEEIDFLVSVFGISPFVKVVTIDSSEIELFWQKLFKLM